MPLALRHAILVVVVAAAVAAVMAQAPIRQPPSYHDFADGRAFLGVPNLLNVATNIPFLVVGLMGFSLCLRRRQPDAPWSWITFFAGVTLVFLGSAYYHVAPNDATLVWDRLPMTVGFMGLLLAVLAEHATPRLARYGLVPAVTLGVLSVLYWSYTDDLRPYFSVQAAALLGVAATLLLHRTRYSHRRLLWGALLTYGLAVASEQLDDHIYALTFNALSGHSLKHLLAALALFWIYLMLRRREAVT